MATGNLTLRPFSIVTKVLYDKDKKKATGVEIIDAQDNKTYEYKAKVVFLCASAFNSTWVLFNSATDVWQGGLGSSSGELVRYSNVHLTLAVPVEATEENLRAATNFDMRDELVARLHQKQLPSAEQITRFPASWRTVALTRSPPLSLGPGDCDLLRAMRDDVFPRLHVRVISSGLRCGAGSDTRIPPRINVNALIPSRT